MKKMKLFSSIALVLVILSFCGCKKDKTEITTTTTADGSVVFWMATVDQFNSIEVYIAGSKKGTITSYNAVAPSCNSSGVVTYTDSPGTYNFTANENGTDKTWAGTVTITSDNCTPFRLE